jgi:hypothetical protein
MTRTLAGRMSNDQWVTRSSAFSSMPITSITAHLFRHNSCPARLIRARRMKLRREPQGDVAHFTQIKQADGWNKFAKMHT